MKKLHAILLLALAGLALPACSKKEQQQTAAAPTPQPTPSAEAQMRKTYGIAAQMPASVESFGDFYNLGKLAGDLQQSKTWNSLMANPLVKEALSDPDFVKGMGEFNANPEAAKWMAILKDAGANEAFMTLGPGSGSKIRVWMDLNWDLRYARVTNALTGNKQTPQQVMLSTIVPYAGKLEIPPMLIGFKMSTQKAALTAELVQAEQNLPPWFEKGSFMLDEGQPFKFIAATAGKVLPPQNQAMLRAMVAENMPDPKSGDAVFQALMDRRIEIAYGFAGDYFIISIGPDHSHLKFTKNYAESIAALPESQVAATYADKPVLGFSWTSAALQKETYQEFNLGEIYADFKDVVTEMLAPEDAKKLETDIKRLDEEGRPIFHHDFTPMVGVVFRDHGLRSEMYGGRKADFTGAPMKFSSVPSESTFLWADSTSNPATDQAARVWFEDFCTSTYGTAVKVVVPMLEPSEQAQVQQFQKDVLPKLVDLYHITTDQFLKGLGSEHAFAMDFGGAMPSFPSMPPEATGGKIPRLAFLSDVHDRALLTQSWENYAKSFTETVQGIPGAGLSLAMTGLSAPVHENVDGVSLSYFKTPANLGLDLGDLQMNVAVSDSTFVAGSSRAWSVALSKIPLKAGDKPLITDVRLNLNSLWDVIEQWISLPAKNPQAYFKGDAKTIAEYNKNHDSIVALIHAMRAFGGVDYQQWEENGLPRQSSHIRWDEK